MASRDDRESRGERDRRDAAAPLEDDLDSLLHEVDADLRGADASLPPLPRASGDDGLSTDAPAAADSYWGLSRMPLTSLVFILPLVLAYEGGVLFLGRSSPRNGADVWLRHILDGLGFGEYFLLPVLTILGLLAWQHVEYDRWRFSPWVLVGMAAECLFLAVVLVGLARLQNRLWPLLLGPGMEGIFARFIGFCGAGLYEEVLFRLLMLPAVAWGLERLGTPPSSSLPWSAVLTSLLFSAAHYVGPLGDTFQLYSFTFRTMAGLFFALLFVVRGFGIAAGTHAAYDMLVALLP
jgi:hypothetical protein